MLSATVAARLNHSLLDASQEIYLLRRAQHGDPDALEELVVKNQRLVAKIAARFTRLAGDCDFEDLLQYGNEGLLVAIWRFDVESGLRFTTYAYWWIRSIMRRYALRHGTSIHRSSREGELIMTIQKAVAQLSAQLHRRPTPEEISVRSGLSIRLVGEILPLIKFSSNLRRIDEPIQHLSVDPDEDDWHDKIKSDDPPVEDQVEAILLSDGLHAAISALPDRWQYVITRHYGLDGQDPWSLTQIGDALGVSRQRIQDINLSSMARLRKAMTGKNGRNGRKQK